MKNEQGGWGEVKGSARSVRLVWIRAGCVSCSVEKIFGWESRRGGQHPDSTAEWSFERQEEGGEQRKTERRWWRKWRKQRWMQVWKHGKEWGGIGGERLEFRNKVSLIFHCSFSFILTLFLFFFSLPVSSDNQRYFTGIISIQLLIHSFNVLPADIMRFWYSCPRQSFQLLWGEPQGSPRLDGIY